MKKIIISLSVIVLLGVIVFLDKNKDVESNSYSLKLEASNVLALKLETSPGSGIYEDATTTSWPDSNYSFNSNLSRCENGSVLTWDEASSAVVMNSTVSDKCYIYFDMVG